LRDAYCYLSSWYRFLGFLVNPTSPANPEASKSIVPRSSPAHVLWQLNQWW